MRKEVILTGLFLMMLVLVSSLAAAQTSSAIKRTFVVSESAVSEEAVFLSPEEVKSAQGADIWDVLIFIAGVIAIIIVVILILRNYLGKKPEVATKARRTARKKKG